jgi:hypothetical protein
MAEGDIGVRTATVFLEDYDVGVAETMGGELIETSIDGEYVQEYALRCDDVTGPPEYNGLVPIYMGEPEPAYAEHLIPQIIISRGSIDPDMARWHNQGFEYRVAAVDAVMVPVAGTDPVQFIPDKIESKAYAFPFNISYDLHIRARHRRQADLLLKKVGKIFWAYGQIRFKDKTGCERGYYAFVESIQALNEIIDVTDRLQGHTFSMRVEAELDFREPYVQKTIHTFTANYGLRATAGAGAPYQGGPAALKNKEDC